MSRSRFTALGRGIVSWVGRRPLVPLALALLGCVENGRPLVIVQAQEPATTAGACGTAIEQAGAKQEGVLDVALDQDYPYLLHPLVESRLPSLVENQIELNQIVLTAAEIEIEPPPGLAVPWTPSCAAKFDMALSLKLLPQATGSGPLEIIRPCHTALFRDLFKKGKLPWNGGERIRFHASVRLKGRHGGTTISSDPFTFPVRVCYGCLQSGYDDPDYQQFSVVNVPRCSKLTSGNPYPGNACNPGQDKGPILCCAKDNDAVVCPAPVGAPVGQ